MSFLWCVSLFGTIPVIYKMIFLITMMKFFKQYLSLVLIIIFLLSCKKESEFNGLKESKVSYVQDGIYIEFIPNKGSEFKISSDGEYHSVYVDLLSDFDSQLGFNPQIFFILTDRNKIRTNHTYLIQEQNKDEIIYPWIRFVFSDVYDKRTNLIFSLPLFNDRLTHFFKETRLRFIRIDDDFISGSFEVDLFTQRYNNEKIQIKEGKFSFVLN